MSFLRGCFILKNKISKETNHMEDKYGNMVGNTELQRQKINELVEKIEDTEFLEFLYHMLRSFKKKWGV